MTDETVGPELPAATGGWTNGRARGGASIRNPLLAGCGVGGSLGCRPGHYRSWSHPFHVTSDLPLAAILRLLLPPLRKEGQWNQARWAPDPAASAHCPLSDGCHPICRRQMRSQGSESQSTIVSEQ